MLYRLLKRAGHRTQQASYLKTHYKEGFYGMDEGKIPYDKLEEMRFWIYNETSLKLYDMVEIKDSPDHVACDDCGILVPSTYCGTDVVEWVSGKERQRIYCNRCRIYSSDSKIRDTGRRSTCEDCKLQSCTYWKEFHKENFREPVQSPSPRQLEHRPTNPQERYSAL